MSMMRASEQITAGNYARVLRKRHGLTLDELAAKLDLSKGHLSRFERGEKALSVSSLVRLADALDTTVGVLLGEATAESDIRLSKANAREFLHVNENEAVFKYALLSGKGAHETFLVELEEGRHHQSPAEHPGLELLFVVSGDILMTLARREIAMSTGDYLEFPGVTPHSIQGVGGKAVVLIVVLEP
jgi:transcriptional regulator with XRE-family HTH domain